MIKAQGIDDRSSKFDSRGDESLGPTLAPVGDGTSRSWWPVAVFGFAWTAWIVFLLVMAAS